MAPRRPQQLYVLCASMDVAGATAAYRVRTEALSAAMHVSHTVAKALACAGLPAYPIPPGAPSRLYWSDVLACATLSALCEPVSGGLARALSPVLRGGRRGLHQAWKGMGQLASCGAGVLVVLKTARARVPFLGFAADNDVFDSMAATSQVRIYVALPARVINCTVSTVLYRHAGAAPSYLEALLLSASCHGACGMAGFRHQSRTVFAPVTSMFSYNFAASVAVVSRAGLGLLLQHSVESHYRRTFRASGAHAVATAAAAAQAAAAAPLDAAVAADSHDAVAAVRVGPGPAAVAAAVSAATETVATGKVTASAVYSGEAAKPELGAPAAGAAATAVVAASATVSSVSAREYVSPLRALHLGTMDGREGLHALGEEAGEDDGDMARSVPALSSGMPSLLTSVSEAAAAAMAWPGSLGVAPGAGAAEAAGGGGPWPATPGPGSGRQAPLLPPSTLESLTHREAPPVRQVGQSGVDSAAVPTPPGAASTRASIDSAAAAVASIASAVGARNTGPEALAFIASGIVQEQPQQPQRQPSQQQLLQQQRHQEEGMVLAAQPASFGTDAAPSAGPHLVARGRQPDGPSSLTPPAPDGGHTHHVRAVPPADAPLPCARIAAAAALLQLHPNSTGTPSSHALLSHGWGFGEGLLPSLPGWAAGLPAGMSGLPLEESPPGAPWGSSIDSVSPAKGAVSASSRSTAAWPSSAALLLQSLSHPSLQLSSVLPAGEAAAPPAQVPGQPQHRSPPGQPRTTAPAALAEEPQQQQQQQQQPAGEPQLAAPAPVGPLQLRSEAVRPPDETPQTPDDSAALCGRMLVTVGSMLVTSTAVHANSLGRRSSNSNSGSGSGAWRGAFAAHVAGTGASGGGSGGAITFGPSRGATAGAAALVSTGPVAAAAAGTGSCGASSGGSGGTGNGSQGRLPQARVPTLAGCNDSGAAGRLEGLRPEANDADKAARPRRSGSAWEAAQASLLTMSATGTDAIASAGQEGKGSITGSRRPLARGSAAQATAVAAPASAGRSSGAGSGSLQVRTGGGASAGAHSGSVKAAAKRLASRVLTALKIKSKKKKPEAGGPEAGRE